MKNNRNISIIEFAEDVLGAKLTIFQECLLEEMYKTYKRDPKNFKISPTITTRRGDARNTMSNLMINMIIIDEFYKLEHEEVNENGQ